jgi:hypothetical protein
MAFFFKSPAAPAAQPAPPLIKINSPTATGVTDNYQQDPSAAKLMTPNQTPAQYVDQLKANNKSTEAINFLAHGMPSREGVHWACKSSDTVAKGLAPADQQALQAAKAWTANPNPATQQAAAAAASKTNFQSPAAWAAQGAAWAPPNGGPVPPGQPNLTGHAVSGSVQLAAAQSVAPPQAPSLPTIPAAPTLAAPTLQQPPAPAIPQPAPPPTPAAEANIAKVQNPYVDGGIQIAAGKDAPG